MASFTANIGQVDPTIINTGLSGNVRQMQPNRSFGELFSGLAAAGNSFAQGADQEMRTKIALQTAYGARAAGQDLLDQARSNLTGGAPAASQGSPSGTPAVQPQSTTPDSPMSGIVPDYGPQPQQQTQSGGQPWLNDPRALALKTALKQGTIDRGAYFLQMTAIANQSTQMAPGWADVATQEAGTMAYRDPAFKAAEALDAQQQQSNATANGLQKMQYDEFQKAAPYVMSDQGSAMYQKLTGKPFDPNNPSLEAMNTVRNSIEAQKIDGEAKKLEFSNIKDNRDLVGQFAFDQLNKGITGLTSNILGTAKIDTGHGQMMTPNQILQEWINNPKFQNDPNKVELFQKYGTQIQGIAAANYSAFLSNPDNQAYLSSLTPNQRKDLEDTFMNHWNILSKNFTEGYHNLSSVVADEATLTSKEQSAQWAQSVPLWPLYSNLMKVFNDPKQVNDVMTGMVLNPGDPTDNAATRFRKQMTDASRMSLGLSTGMTNPNDLSKSDASPQSAAAAIKQAPLILIKPELSDEGVKTIVNNLYNPKNNDLTQYAKQNPEAFLSSYLNPSVTKRVLATGDKLTITKYTIWAEDASVAVLGSAGRTLDSFVSNTTSGFGLTLDPKTGHLIVQAGPQPGASGSQFLPDNPAMLGDRMYNTSSMRDAQTAVTKVNNWVDQMLPLWKQSNMTPQQGLYIAMGNRDIIRLSQQSPFVSRMLNLLQNTFKPTDDTKGTEPPPLTLAPKSRVQGDAGTVQNASFSLPDFIGKAEGADYNTAFGGRQLDLSNMTVDQVSKLGKAWGDATGSSAMGKYQVMHGTLKDMIKEGVVNPDDVYNKDTQDKIAQALLERRGLSDYKSGKISKEQFAKNLSQEWASLPNPETGQSYYAGDSMRNKSTVTLPSFLSQLQ